MSQQMDVTKQIQILQTRADAMLDSQEDNSNRLDELEARVDELEDENERLRDRLDETDGGQDTIEAIVEYAANKRNQEPVVKVKPKEIAGAAGVSERYGYKLCNTEKSECLADRFCWVLTPDEMQQYGALEMDVGDQPRVLGIDFEGVHSAGVPLNRFNNEREGKEGSE